MFFFFLFLSGEAETQKKEEDELEEIAGRLTQIADEIPFIPPDLETDSTEGEFRFPPHRINTKRVGENILGLMQDSSSPPKPFLLFPL